MVFSASACYVSVLLSFTWHVTHYVYYDAFCVASSSHVCVFVLHEVPFVWFYEVLGLVGSDTNMVLTKFTRKCINHLVM